MNRENSLATASSSQLSRERARPSGGFLLVFILGFYAAGHDFGFRDFAYFAGKAQGEIVDTDFVASHGVAIIGVNLGDWA